MIDELLIPAFIQAAHEVTVKDVLIQIGCHPRSVSALVHVCVCACVKANAACGMLKQSKHMTCEAIGCMKINHPSKMHGNRQGSV